MINQTLADFTVLDAAPNPPPVSIDSLLKPIGVISKPILLVAFPGDGLAGALVGDHKGKDSEAEEEEDEEEHDEEVYPQEPGDSATRADEARD